MMPSGVLSMGRAQSLAGGVAMLAILLTNVGSQAFEINGVVLGAFGWDGLGPADAGKTLTWIRCLGATDVAILTENNVDVATDTVYNVKGYSGPNANLKSAIMAARSLGLRVTIKPHYLNDRTNDNLQWPSYRPKSNATFFKSYTANILAHAKIAQSAGATRLALGTEMGGQLTGAAMLPYWRTVISQVRSVFKGKLTYSAAFSAEWNTSPYANEAAYVAFWPLLDEAGFNLYPNLTKKKNPTLSELVSKYTKNDDGTKIIPTLQALAKKVNRPMLLMETGFRSVPNYWNSGDWITSYSADGKAQALLHQAEQYALAPYGSTWLNGLFLWYADPDQRTSANAKRWDTDYIFQGKPAAAVIRSIFLKGKPAPVDAKGKPLACPKL